jgi:hypothetical protein
MLPWTSVQSASSQPQREDDSEAVPSARSARIGRCRPPAGPEAVYFTEQDGHPGAVMVIQVETPSQVPSFAEPWFLNLDADCRFRIVMSPEDLRQAGLDELGKTWG